MPQPTAAQSLDLAAQLSGLTSQAISDIQASFSTQTALWELAAIVFVGFLSLSIYRMLRKWIYRHLPPAKSPGFSVKMKRWCLLFI